MNLTWSLVTTLHSTFSHSRKVSSFDTDKFSRALELFQGTHNFATFTLAPSYRKHLEKLSQLNSLLPEAEHSDPTKSAIKTLTDVRVVEVSPTPLELELEPLLSLYRRIDVVITGSSFLHNQVRRMVGAGVAVATDVIGLEGVKRMLDEPHPLNWNSKCQTLPPQGLTLVKVDFGPESLVSTNQQGTYSIFK